VSATSRELREAFLRQIYAQPRVEREPGDQKVVVNLSKVLAEGAVSGRFYGPASRLPPDTARTLRAEAIVGLARNVAIRLQDDLPTSCPHIERSRSLQFSVLTRAEFPPLDKSNDIRQLRGRVKNRCNRLYPKKSNRAKCGRRRYRPDVEVRARGDRSFVVGVVRCGSVWCCPTCASFISAVRAAQLRAVVGAHRVARANEQAPGETVYMLTFTLRHSCGMALGPLLKSLQHAWQETQRGAPWKRLKRAMGFVGSVSAREVTHGENGWHPHIHVLLALKKPLDDARRLELEQLLYERWCAALDRVAELKMGKPSRANGVRLDVSHSDDYLQKLGLAGEMTRLIDKRAKGGNRTPFEIMADYADAPTEADAALIREHYRATKGKRLLTWSRGKDGANDLRQIYAGALAALVEQSHQLVAPGFETDEEIMEREESGGVLVASLQGRQFDALRNVLRVVGRDAEHELVVNAERDGANGVENLLMRAFAAGRKLARHRPRLRRWIEWLAPPDDELQAERWKRKREREQV
jgi:hypothetical protein